MSSKNNTNPRKPSMKNSGQSDFDRMYDALTADLPQQGIRFKGKFYTDRQEYLQAKAEYERMEEEFKKKPKNTHQL